MTKTITDWTSAKPNITS